MYAARSSTKGEKRAGRLERLDLLVLLPRRIALQQQHLELTHLLHGFHGRCSSVLTCSSSELHPYPSHFRRGMPRSLDSDHSPPSQHISIDLTSDAPAPLLPPPRPAAPYPPHLPSPRGNNSFDWDRFPTPSVQTSSSRSTSTSSSYRQDPPLASVASSSTSNGDVEADDEERDALELSSVAQGKQRASDLYGEVEGAATDSLEDDGQPMLGGRSSAMGSRRTPKGQRAKAATAARRRKLVVGFSMIAGLLVVLSVAGRDRIPRDWRFERWRSSSAPSSGGNGSSVRMEDGTEFIYRNDL